MFVPALPSAKSLGFQLFARLKYGRFRSNRASLDIQERRVLVYEVRVAEDEHN